MLQGRYISSCSFAPYSTAWIKYQWPEKEDGFCVEENTIHIATMAGKHIAIKMKRSKILYGVDPTKALQSARERKSYFTNKQGKLVAVIPKSICYKIIE